MSSTKHNNSNLFPSDTPTILERQQTVNRIRRRLRDNDARFETLVAERRMLLAELLEAAQQLRDARYAGWLAAQGAGAVAAVEEMLEI